MSQSATVIGIAVTPKVMAPMETRDAVDITIETGLDGDARGKKRRRQVSILFEDDWNDAVAETGEPMDWTERRANIFVRGMRAPQCEGGLFTIGDVTLQIEEETEPCDLMESKREGLRASLSPDWRGGVCCKVISGGHIAIGDSLTYADN